SIGSVRPTARRWCCSQCTAAPSIENSTTVGLWVERSRCWHPAVSQYPLPPIAMISLYCDESHDERVYALGGWVATPSAWDRFTPAWRAMLDRHPMPNGSRMPAFHASEIVGR